MRRRAAVAVLAVVALVAAGCSSDEGPTVVLAPVTAGEVVETVAAPTTIEPRDRVSVAAPASGTVAELFVEDGDQVTAGDPVARLTAPSIDQSIAQAQAAVDAADALSGVQAGIDLSPLIGAVSDQLAAVVPDLLQALAEQAATLPEPQREQANQAIRDAIDGYNESQQGLQRAEADAASTAGAATASQRAAAEAQRRQAELALEAARSRADDLVVTAPVGGVVELARGTGGSGGAPDLGSLEGLAGGDASSLGDVSGLLGGGGPSTSSSGPVAVGAQVAGGQPLVTVFDLGAFRAVSTVDEIDVVRVAEGQDVLVLVDAFPDVELAGTVEHVAIEPTASAAGGVSYPVTVALEVPDDLALRVGLSGSVEVTTAVVDADTVVPSSALRRRGESDVVVVARDGRVVEVPVVVDAIGDDVAAVTGEVAADDLVVVEGIDEVADGDPVPEDVRTRPAGDATGAPADDG